jgi:hypothetical protein
MDIAPPMDMETFDFGMPYIPEEATILPTEGLVVPAPVAQAETVVPKKPKKLHRARLDEQTELPVKFIKEVCRRLGFLFYSSLIFFCGLQLWHGVN